MRFGPWIPIADAAAGAPSVAGVMQARAKDLLPYPAGRSAMVAYAASGDDEALSAWTGGAGAEALASARRAGAAFVRFAPAQRPADALATLLARFIERFGAPPSGQLRP